MADAIKPLTYTSESRQEQFATLKILKRNRAIDAATYNKSIVDLNKQEQKARARRVKAEAERERREAVAEQQRRIAEAKRQVERDARRKLKQAEYNAKRRVVRAERRAERQQQADRLVTFRVVIRYKTEDDIKRKRTAFRTKVTEKSEKISNMEDPASRLDDLINFYEVETTRESPVAQIQSEGAITSIVSLGASSGSTSSLMRRVATLQLDKEGSQDWNTDNGTCVYDYLISTYGNLKGAKKISNYDELDFIFTGKNEVNKMFIGCETCSNMSKDLNRPTFCSNECKSKIPEDATAFIEPCGGRLYYMFNSYGSPYKDDNPRQDGVCIEQLKYFCDTVGIKMFAYDCNNKEICIYNPRRLLNKNLPNLVFRQMNNHIYPLVDSSTSLTMRRSNAVKQKKKVDDEEEKKTLPVVILQRENEQSKSTTDMMIDIMKQVGKQVYPFNNIKYTKSGVASFKLDDKYYVFDDDDNIATAKAVCDINKIEFVGQSATQQLFQMMKDLKYDTVKSVFNPVAFDILNLEGIKYRTHYGLTWFGQYFIDNDLGGEIESLVPTIEFLEKTGRIHCVDIAKAHTSVLMSPMDDWLVYDFMDEFEDYDADTARTEEGKLKNGLYYVITYDMNLLHSSNIYSATILNVAEKEGISFVIIKQYIPSYTRPRQYFKPLLDGIVKLCKGSSKYTKVYNNLIAGMLGRTKAERYRAKLSTNPEDVYNEFCTPEYQTNKPLLNRSDDYYLYGYAEVEELAENNLPMYIQILDQTNIKLYYMIKNSGLKCLWRKTDCCLLYDRYNTGIKIKVQE